MCVVHIHPQMNPINLSHFLSLSDDISTKRLNLAFYVIEREKVFILTGLFIFRFFLTKCANTHIYGRAAAATKILTLRCSCTQCINGAHVRVDSILPTEGSPTRSHFSEIYKYVCMYVYMYICKLQPIQIAI